MQRSIGSLLLFFAAAVLLALSMIVGLAGHQPGKGYALLILSLLVLTGGIASESPPLLRAVLWILVVVFAFGTADYTSSALLGRSFDIEVFQFTL